MPRASFDLGGGAALELSVPDGAAPIAADRLPAFELGPVSGARVVAKAGWEGAFGTLYVACATAPAGGFAPGVDELVFARATAILRQAVPGLERLDAAPREAVGRVFMQALDGEARVGKPVHVAAAHVLGFTARAAEAFVCTTACVDASVSSGDPPTTSSPSRLDHDACERAVGSMHASGQLAEPPSPSALVSGIFAAVEHPVPFVIGAALIGLVASWILVARRPRRPRA